MILFEFEGKKLLKEAGVDVPKSQLITSESQKVEISAPFFAKAQVLSGKRAEKGGITTSHPKRLLGQKIDGEVAKMVLVEERVEFESAYYLSLSYDGDHKGPVLSFSDSGGSGIEEKGAKVFPIDVLTKSLVGASFPRQISKVLPKLMQLFFDKDLLLLEINPLVVTKKGVVALDAKVKIDDSSLARHPELKFPPRLVSGRKPTKREVLAKKIDEKDHRGVAGSTYFDLKGDIAILASGGGGSLVAMDALFKAGGKPANYTEYSGNPPKEKVEKLTKIVLSKKGLNALFVVGAVANFTDIYETLSGFLEALYKVKPRPKYPIVIRRGGPRDKEAFNMLKKVKDFDLHVFGDEISISEAAEKVAKLAKKYASST